MTQIRVLLADDVDRIRALIRELLDLDGRFQVVAEASDGEGAIECAARERPDVVVIDHRMPGMRAMDAVSRIRADLPKARIVMLSGYSAEDMAQVALDAGADAYVEKGAPVSELIETLHPPLRTPEARDHREFAASGPRN